MRKRLFMVLGTIVPFGLVPVAALAQGCGEYPLTPAQAEYLQNQVPYVKVPTGNTTFIARCDVDGNGIINNDDLFIIRANRGQVPALPDDPMDWDGNGIIHGRDVGGCASSCTLKGCAVRDDVEEEEGMQSAAAMAQTDLPGQPGPCYQVGDFDGDGAQDFIGIYEYTGGETRGNNWLLQLVILTEDGSGNVQHTEFQYSGQVTDGNTDLLQHLSVQPAGPVDLNPGGVMLSRPGIISYRRNEPHSIFYYSNGTLNRAFFGIDD